MEKAPADTQDQHVLPSFHTRLRKRQFIYGTTILA